MGVGLRVGFLAVSQQNSSCKNAIRNPSVFFDTICVMKPENVHLLDWNDGEIKFWLKMGQESIGFLSFFFFPPPFWSKSLYLV